MLTSAERGWLSLVIFAGFILLLDRLSNAIPDLRPYDGICYVISILALSCWAGLFAGLGACVTLIAYLWLIYHFYPISIVVRNPHALRQVLVATGILMPPFALIGGAFHFIVRRATARFVEARHEAEREAEQRRQAEAELWVSEEMRRVIVDSSVDAVVGIAPDMRITLWSPNAERMFGWSRQEALGAPAGSKVIAPAPGAATDAGLLGLLESESPPILRQCIETRAATKSNETVDVEIYIVDHRTPSGTMYLLFAHDISERKRAEAVIRELNEDLRDLNATLEVRVAERTRELEAANEELLAFNHSVSHDLHAPLRAIVANTRMLCQDAEGVLDERLFERLRRTEENALKMGRLMDDLLSYSRLGKAAIRMARVDVSALASRIGADVSLRTPGKIEVQPGICVEGDPEMIEIVLRNLIENAWKYVDAGVPPIVEVGMTGDGAVFVRDHGIGFDMKYIDQVWEPFARLHSSREYPGSGIGLANSKRIIQRHGGRLWAESAPGKGTTFYFVLGEPGFFAHEELGGNSARLR